MVRALRGSRPLRRRGRRRRRRRGQVHGLRGARPDRGRLRGAARRHRPRGGDGAEARRSSSRTGATTSWSAATSCLGDPDAAFAEADGTISGHRASRPGSPARRSSRAAASPPTTRTRRRLTFWDSTQDPHPLRILPRRDAAACRRPRSASSSRTSAAASGSSMPTFQEEPLVAYLSRKLGRPVKWIEERSRELPGRRPRARHALPLRGRLQERRHGHGHPPRGDRRRRRADRALRLGHVVRHLVLPAVRLQDPELGDAPPLGRDEQVPVERLPRLRQGRRLVPDGPDHGPHREGDRARPGRGPLPQLHPARRVPVSRRSPGRCSTAATTPGALRTVLDMVDYEGFAGLQEEARSEGRYIGLGIGQELTPEGCSMPGSLLLCGYDGDRGAGQPDGRRHRAHRRHLARQRQRDRRSPRSWPTRSAASSTGSGSIQGDTESCPWGFGNYSSRSIIIGGSAAHLAALDVPREDADGRGSSMLEVAPEDLDAADGGHLGTRRAGPAR